MMLCVKEMWEMKPRLSLSVHPQACRVHQAPWASPCACTRDDRHAPHLGPAASPGPEECVWGPRSLHSPPPVPEAVGAETRGLSQEKERGHYLVSLGQNCQKEEVQDSFLWPDLCQFLCVSSRELVT